MTNKKDIGTGHVHVKTSYTVKKGHCESRQKFLKNHCQTIGDVGKILLIYDKNKS